MNFSLLRRSILHHPILYRPILHCSVLVIVAFLGMMGGGLIFPETESVAQTIPRAIPQAVPQAIGSPLSGRSTPPPSTPSLASPMNPLEQKEPTVKITDAIAKARQHPDDPVEFCAEAIAQDRLFAEALDILRPWTLRPEIATESLSRGIDLTVLTLRNLNRVAEIDPYLEALVTAHPNDWRVLVAVANQYQSIPHYGASQADRFIRGEQNGLRLNSTDRDRVRTLQLYRQAEPLVAQGVADSTLTAEKAFDFYRMFGESYFIDPPWKMQLLTDLDTLPEPTEWAYSSRQRSDAPVDAGGNPVFYHAPPTFDAAVNDGERWRWGMARAVEICPQQQSLIDNRLATFLQGQFGVATLREYNEFFRDLSESLDGPNDESDHPAPPTDGIWSLHTLSDDETIARLATGIKRFTLPDDQNYLRYYKNVEKNGSAAEKYHAGLQIAREYMNRRQYAKAAEIYESLIPYETTNQAQNVGTQAAEMYAQITGNWGAFDPLASKAAGTEVVLSWRFRNGKNVSFTAHRVNVPLLIDDIKAYLTGLEKSTVTDLDGNRTQIETIGWRLMNDPAAKSKYLGEQKTGWTTKLSPAADHAATRSDIPFPVKDPGAYLVLATMDDGNTDAILVWLNDTALVRKPLDNTNLWFVADAVTGEPVPDASLDFFGYTTYHTTDARGRSTNKVSLKTATFLQRTDTNGLAVQKSPKIAIPNPYLQWLVVASAPQKNQKSRFAYFGFSPFWYNSRNDFRYQNDKAYFVSDRPVYRPGDVVEYKFWVGRAQYDLKETWHWGNKTVWLKILDPTGTEIVNQRVKLDETGGYTERLETGLDAKLGEYSFLLTEKLDENWLGNGVVRIEEYKKPEFEVTVDAPTEPIKLGDTVMATITAKYYFGAPVQNGKVKYTVTRTKKTERWFPQRPWDWLYGNGYGWLAPNADWYPGWSRWGIGRPMPPWFPWHNPAIPEIVAEQELELDEEGTVKVEIDSSLAAAIFPKDDQEYKIDAEVTDLSRRTILGSGSVQVAREPFRVYCWTDRGFAEPGQQITATIQTRRIDGKPVSGNALLKLFRIRYEPTADGKSVTPVETQVYAEEVSVKNDGIAKIRFTAGEAGQYRLAATVTDSAKNRRDGGTLLTVRGGAKSDPTAFRSGPLELIPEKAEYRRGETVQLAIHASRLQPPSDGNVPDTEATVLLFVRTLDGICPEPIRLTTESGRAEYSFQVTDADVPNIFVEALTIHGGNYYQEQREIPVVPEKRVIEVEVTPSESAYKPGEKAAAKIRLTDPDGKPVVGEIVAAIYDRSVEYISGGSNIPDLKSYFWDWKRSSNPQHDDNLERISMPIPWDQKKFMRGLGMFDAAMTAESPGRNGSGGGIPPMMRNRALGLRGGGGGMETMMAMDAVAPMAAMTEEAAPMFGVAGTTMGKSARAEMAHAEKGMRADRADQESGAPVMPTIRQNFADTALWVGRLKTDAAGEANITLDMPENLTTWKIRVWSFASGTRVGEGTTEILTKKDLIVRMQRPRFLTQTDTVTLSANVHNYLEREKEVTVSLEIPPDDNAAVVADTLATPEEKTAIVESILELDESQAVRRVTVPAGGEARIDWVVTARGIGNVPLVMKAITDEESDGVQESLNVKIHGMLQQASASGMISGQEENSTTESSTVMTVPSARLADQTKLTVRFSPTLAASMIDAIPYLADYPYGCTEQTLHRFLPMVQSRRLLQRLGVNLERLSDATANLNAQQLGSGRERREKTEKKNPIFDSATVEKMTDDGVARLAEMQNSDGGWGWFSGYEEKSSPHLTALVTRGLLSARAADIPVEPSVTERGIVWLEAELQRQTIRRLHGETWSDDAKREAPGEWKNSVDANDALIYGVLIFAGRRPQSASVGDPSDASAMVSANLARMKNYLWQDRANLPLYALALYGTAMADEDLSANADPIALCVRTLRQSLVLDDENQTARLDSARAHCWGGAWRWWSWYGNDIETQAAFLRLLVRTEPTGDLAPRLVKYLLNNRRNGTYWDSTRDTAIVLEAFGEYIAASGEAAQPMTVELLLNGKMVHTCDISPERLFDIDNTFTTTELSDGEQIITLRRTGSGPLYWNTYLQNFTLEERIPATGLEVKIDRRYERLTEDTDAQVAVVGGHGQAISQRVKRWNREPIAGLSTVQSGDLIEVELLIESKNDYDSLLIEDHKPAGFEPVDLRSGYTDNTLGAYVEFRDDRVSFFVNQLSGGKHSVRYRLRAEIPGQFSALPATILGMYAPELSGNSEEFKVRVGEK